MSLLETSRALLSYAERLDNAELLGKIRDLQGDGLELLQENVCLTKQVHDLEAQVASLNEKLFLVGEMLFIKGLYHILNTEGQIGQPYCPNCWESKRQAVHLHWEQRKPVGPCYQCKTCSGTYNYYCRNPELTPDRIEGH